MNDEIVLKNFMEDCVDNVLQKVIADMDICKCRRCQLDIAAFALNQLPPKYIATNKGHVYAKINALNIQAEADIIAAISNGAQLVGGNPRHE